MDRSQLLRELGILPEELAFWECEFADCGLSPAADGTFEPAAVQKAFLLKRLLREEGFTLWGAKRRLKRVGISDMPPGSGPSRELAQAECEVLELIRRLDDILQCRQG